MKKHLARIFLVAALLAGPSWAEPVMVGGQTIMRLPDDRARVVQRRVDELLSRGADPEKIQFRKVGDDFGVYWGSTKLLTVGEELAKEKQSTPRGLAKAWAERLYDAVGPGYLKLSPKSLVLPVNGTANLRVSGLAQGAITVENGGGFVATQAQGENIRVKASRAGRSTILVRRGHRTVRVPIRVKDLAGYVPPSVKVQVTGNPAPADMVARSALRALSGSARLQPGARLKLPKSLPKIPSVPRGRRLRFDLPVQIAASSDYFPVNTKVQVEVESVSLKLREANLLMVSNRPERVDKDGVLLEYEFSEAEPSRLMYSHLNESRKPRRLWVNLYNEGSQPVRVWIGSSFAGPNRNEVHTGHMAAVRFLRQLGSESGFVMEIPPRGRFVVAEHLLSAQDLLSGFVNLQVMGPGKLRAEVHSKLSPSRSNETRNSVRLGGPFNPFKIHPHGVFAQPYFEEWIDMTDATPEVAVPYGKSPWLIDFETGLPNTGNFGVLYRYHFVIKNTKPRAMDFELFFRPQSGPGAGTFLVDGDILEAPFRRRGVETSLGRFRVEAGQERTVSVVTLPEASSNYPAQLFMRRVNP